MKLYDMILKGSFITFQVTDDATGYTNVYYDNVALTVDCLCSRGKRPCQHVDFLHRMMNPNEANIMELQEFESALLNKFMGAGVGGNEAVAQIRQMRRAFARFSSQGFAEVDQKYKQAVTKYTSGWKWEIAAKPTTAADELIAELKRRGIYEAVQNLPVAGSASEKPKAPPPSPFSLVELDNET
jgi:hypothetical protein